MKIDIRDLPNSDDQCVTVLIEGETMPYNIDISHQITGFGVKQFFICPMCGSRREYLYLKNGELLCRNCLPKKESPYRIIKNSTKGGHRYISYMMHQIAYKYGIKLDGPFCYLQLALKKPKYMHDSTWERVARELQMLESFRVQSIPGTLGSYHSRIYKVKDIQYALNHCLYLFDLDELYEYRFSINWKNVIEGMQQMVYGYESLLKS